ncbi:hypothetical protein ACFWZ4_13030 [Frateuria sp. GZRe12]|uniref:hypothetical protein n=1 Tax=Frateuria sp. GZRe12 TaxID=3351533 RepID=UPI003EDB777B
MHLESEVIDFSATLRRRIRCTQRFLTSRLGSDLWVDGVDALLSTPVEILQAYTSVLLRRIEREIAKSKKATILEFFAAFDDFLAYCVSRGESAIYHGLAAGMCTLRFFDSELRAGDIPFAVVNDSLMVLVCNQYRAVRFYAFNSGIEIYASTKNGAFRPDLGAIVIGPPVLVPGRPSRVQSFSLIHELCHAALFGDSYCRMFGSIGATKSMLLNIEESIIGLDLLLYGSLRKMSPAHLEAQHEFERLVISKTNDINLRRATLARGAMYPTEFVRSLRATAQRRLNEANAFSERILSLDAGEDVSNWVGPNALDFHIRGLAALTSRIEHPTFRKIVDLLPRDPVQQRNSFQALGKAFGLDDCFHECSIEAPSRSVRKHNLRASHSRRTMIRCAEIAIGGRYLSASQGDSFISRIMEIAGRFSTCDAGEPCFSRWVKQEAVHLLEHAVRPECLSLAIEALSNPFLPLDA